MKNSSREQTGSARFNRLSGELLTTHRFCITVIRVKVAEKREWSRRTLSNQSAWVPSRPKWLPQRICHQATQRRFLCLQMPQLKICTCYLRNGATGSSRTTTGCQLVTKSLAEVRRPGCARTTPAACECAAGHYGVVKIGHRIIDGEPFAVKTIVKKRPLYVLMMVCPHASLCDR